MAATRYSKPSPPSVQDRYDHLEGQVSSIAQIVNKVASTLDSSMAEAKEYRERSEKESLRIWEAIESQSKRFYAAFEKINDKGQLSWGMIATAITTILAVGVAVASVGWMLSESRIRQLEIADTYAMKLMDAKLESLQIKEESLHDLGRENHSAIRGLEQRDH